MFIASKNRRVVRIGENIRLLCSAKRSEKGNLALTIGRGVVYKTYGPELGAVCCVPYNSITGI